MSSEFEPTGAPALLGGVRVLITGATSGIGLAMARALTTAGATVAIGSRDRDRARAAAAGLPAAGGAFGVALDVRDEGRVAAGVAEVVALAGGLDVLVNNAGLGMRTVNPHFMTDPQPFWQVSPDGFRDLLATNLTGYFLTARAVVPHFLDQGRGRIVNISMNHETMRRRGFVPYGPSRAGAESLSHIMAADLQGTSITVNMLLPGGATLTGMIPDEADGQVRSRLLNPEVMAAPIRWLCSPQAEGLTGERIVATEFDRWLAARMAARG
ncbi:MAG: SDR family oxidoreductase [Candidatus Dormibacteria bacterium]